MDRYEIKLISKRHLGGEYDEFRFTKPDGFDFTPGQYGVFLFHNKTFEDRKMRAFSFACAPTDDFIAIATRIGSEPSPYKQALRDMQEGESLTLAGPTGTFAFVPGNDAVYIVGGIGITPIRSFLRANVAQLERQVLIFSERSENFPFREELETMEDLDVHYVSGIEPTSQIVRNTVFRYGNQAVYYVVGGPGFLSGIQQQLTDLGIALDHIKFDRFTGY